MTTLLDFLFPKKCVACKKFGSYLCENCFSYLSFDVKSLCLVCNRPSFDGLTHPRCVSRYTPNGCFSALSYNKTAKKLIYNFKFEPYVSNLKTIIGDLFYDSLIQNEEFNRQLSKSKNWIFVPIPLYKKKLKKRGYNQARILAKGLSENFGFPVVNCLERTRDTKTQVGLKHDERKKNIKGAFSLVNHKSSIINRKSINVFLVDDIATTGSTLLEATNVLKRGGVKRVIALTLARD